jgi:hypothetical protein
MIMFRPHQRLLIHLSMIQAVLRNGGAADVFAAGLVLLEELLDIQYLYEHQRESEALTAYLSKLMAEDLSHKERCDRLASKLKAMRLKWFETSLLLNQLSAVWSLITLHALRVIALSAAASGHLLCCWVRKLAPWRWTL